MNDDQILDLYFARDERAIRETNETYGAYCMQVAERILCDRQDAEEMVNDTLLRAWHTIPPKRPVVFKLYLAKIVRNLAFSRYRARAAEKRGGGELTLALEELSECVGGGDDPQERVDVKELTVAIQRFLDTVSPRDRKIFIRRYFFVESTADIASRFGLKESNVLMILVRVRKKLKGYLIKEGFWL
ncbi:MAG: RNA polymerase sigma factor [Ruminococcaceae bacterium]|nr:RNA polymerase sigma factor [Oscillospiraceae bacterium]